MLLLMLMQLKTGGNIYSTCTYLERKSQRIRKMNYIIFNIS